MQRTSKQSIYHTRLQIALLDHDISNREFCRRIKISPAYLTLMLQKKRPITRSVREKITNTFAVNFGD